MGAHGDCFQGKSEEKLRISTQKIACRENYTCASTLRGQGDMDPSYIVETMGRPHMHSCFRNAENLQVIHSTDLRILWRGAKMR